MGQVKLNKVFEPSIKFDLVRVGRQNDGGYLVPKECLKLGLPLVSFGINDDWSFESEILDSNWCPSVYMFDPTSNIKNFIRYTLKNLFHFPRLEHFFNSINAVRTWREFIRRSNVHFYSFFIGRKISGKSLTFLEAISRLELTEKKINLKIDIEGSEYRILEELINYRDNINFLIIEFHHFDIMENQIILFLERIDMNIAHIHINNYGDIDDFGVPEFVEVTLVNKDIKGQAITGRVTLPHAQDCPSDRTKEEIEVLFHYKTNIM